MVIFIGRRTFTGMPPDNLLPFTPSGYIVANFNRVNAAYLRRYSTNYNLPLSFTIGVSGGKSEPCKCGLPPAARR